MNANAHESNGVRAAAAPRFVSAEEREGIHWSESRVESRHRSRRGHEALRSFGKRSLSRTSAVTARKFREKHRLPPLAALCAATLVFFALCLPSSVHAATRYVNLANPTPAAPYMDWPTAATNLSGAPWTSVPGQLDVPGTGGGQALSDTNAAAPRFYRVLVRRP